jgi:hypothetical protein
METEPGVTAEYSLREMDGTQRDTYLNGQRQRTTIRDGHVEIKDFKGHYSALLALCLYDPEGKLVPEKIIQTYPTSAQAALFDAGQQINKLDRVGSTGAMSQILTILRAELSPEDAVEAIRTVVQLWRKGEEEEQPAGES